LALRRRLIESCWPDIKVGTIGDAAHLAEHSDHNPDSRGIVHAIDVMVGLGPVADAIVAWAVGSPDLEYVVHNGKIWLINSSWTPVAYHGSNPHVDHIHISGKHGSTGENHETGTGYSTTAEAYTAITKPCEGVTTMTNNETITAHGKTVSDGTVLSDLESLRDLLASTPQEAAAQGIAPRPGSYLDIMIQAANHPVSITENQVQTIAGLIVAAIGKKLAA
jgi:hypothetical protein